MDLFFQANPRQSRTFFTGLGRNFFFSTLLAHLAVSGVWQPLEGEIVRLRVDKVVVVELRLEDSGGCLRLQAHPVAHEEDHVLGQPCLLMR